MSDPAPTPQPARRLDDSELADLSRAVIEHTPDAIVAYDRELRITLWNPAAERASGITQAQALGRRLVELFPNLHASERVRWLERALAGEVLEAPELPYDLPATGRSGWTSSRYAPRRNASGEIVGVISVHRDLSERKRSEQLRACYGRIAGLANAAAGMTEVFRGIHEVIAGLMPAANFYIALLHPAGETLDFPYFVDERDAPPGSRKLGRGLTEYVLRTGEPLLARPEVFDDLVARGEVDLRGAPSIDWLGVPLKRAGRPIGVLAVQTYAPGHRYTEEDRDLLAFVSDEVALVIDRRQAEEHLRASEERFRALVERSAEGITLLDASGAILYAGPSTGRLLGGRPDELVDRSAFDLMHPDDQGRARSAFAALVPRPGGTAVFEYRQRRDDGAWRWFEAVATNLLAVSAVHAVVVNYRDVTERHEAAEALHASEQRYRLLFERSLAGIVRTTPDGRIIECNEAFARLLGHACPQDVMALNAADLYFDRRERTEFVARLFQEGSVTGRELRLRRRDGTPVWVLLNDTVVPAQGGDPLVMEATVVDISQIRRAAEEARELARMKSDFMVITSHEMRTPLTIVQGYLELLQAGETLSPAQNECLERCAAGVVRMTRSLADIAAAVELDEGRVRLRPVPTDLAALAGEVVAELRPFAERRCVGLAVVVANRLPLVSVDAARIRLVLLDLVGNAIRFTSDGGEVRLELRSETEGGVHVVVSDNGIGIAASELQRIFERFYTGADPRHHRSGSFEFQARGAGLGLAIVKGYVEAHGGRVWAESAGPGCGAVFHVLLPPVEPSALRW